MSYGHAKVVRTRTLPTGDSDSTLFEGHAFPDRATDSVHNSNHNSQVMESGGVTQYSYPPGNITYDSMQAPCPSTDVGMDHAARRTRTKRALKEGMPTDTSPPSLLLADQLQNDQFQEVDLEAHRGSPNAATQRPIQDRSRPSHRSSLSLLPHSFSKPSPSPHSEHSPPGSLDRNYCELRGGGNRSDLQHAMSSSPTLPRSALPVATKTLTSINHSTAQEPRHSSEKESCSDDDNSLCDLRSLGRCPSHLDPSVHQHVISFDQHNGHDDNNINGQHLYPSSSTLVIAAACTGRPHTLSSLHSIASLNSHKEQNRKPISLSSQELSLDLPDPPDGGWKAWAVVLASVMIQTFAFAPTEFIFGVFEQEYSLMFPGANPSSIALIGTIGTCSTYIVGFLAGTCSDRWGYRVTACAGAIIMTLSLVLASFSTQLWHYYFSQGILYGTGASLAYFSAVAAPTHWFKRKRGLAMGIAASGSGLGGFFLAPLSQYLVDHLGLHWTLRILGLYCLAVCGGAALLLFEPDYSEQDRMMMKMERQRSRANSTSRIPAFSKEWVFAMLVGFQFLLSMAYLTPIYFIEMYSTHIGLSKQMGASINGWFNGASFVARILSGVLADMVATDVVLLACVWTNALSILIIWTFAKGFSVYLFFAIVYGMSFSGTSTVTPVMVADYYGPAQVSSVLGVVYGISCAALLCGSLISGQILEITKPNENYLPVIMYAGGMFALSAFCASIWIFLMRRRRRMTTLEGEVTAERKDDDEERSQIPR